MRRNWTGRLHEIGLVTGNNARVYRFCRNCGATWELVTDENGMRAFQPIQERGADGQLLETAVDVRECPAEVSSPPANVAAAPAANAAVPVVASKPANLCYCPTCRVKQQHFAGNDNCFCVKCQGTKPHKTAA